jgi:two-component system sensor kinase FixL
MASGLAHELNQPLAALQLYVGMASELAQGLRSQQLSHLLQRIGEQAVRAGDIIREMRSFAKREPTQRKSVCLNRLIREVLTLLNHDLKKHAVVLQLALNECLPPVHVNAIQIQQVLTNLIRNAGDAMTAEECRPRTLLLYSEIAPGGVGIGVVDSGSGIRASMAELLFQPFQTDKPNGLGLGLAISRTLIEAHGGRIEARANPSGGATFYFLIPAGPDSAKDANH